MAFFLSGLSGNWLVFFITLANAGMFGEHMFTVRPRN